MTQDNVVDPISKGPWILTQQIGMTTCRSEWPRGLKAWVCSGSIAGIARSLRRADHHSRGILPNVVCLSVIMNPRH